MARVRDMGCGDGVMGCGSDDQGAEIWDGVMGCGNGGRWIYGLGATRHDTSTETARAFRGLPGKTVLQWEGEPT